MMGSDKLGREHEARELASDISCSCADHSQLCQAVFCSVRLMASMLLYGTELYFNHIMYLNLKRFLLITNWMHFFMYLFI